MNRVLAVVLMVSAVVSSYVVAAEIDSPPAMAFGIFSGIVAGRVGLDMWDES